MEKYIFDESNGLWYELNGDYYIPCLVMDEEESRPIGVWGQRHLRYIKQHRRAFYINLLTSGKLNNYLADLNEDAQDMFLRLVDQMTQRENITEHLKTEDQMAWIRRTNNIRNSAAEIVNHDLIYT